MNIGLVDVDSKIPNVALMKLSTYHKNKGDSIYFYKYDGKHDVEYDNLDLCYASKIFDWTPEPNYPECKVIKGGTAYSLSRLLPCDDRTMPDYSLYDSDIAIGRFTRGCPNSCPWCVVPKMDGNNVYKVADLKDFWNGQETVRLLDDNIMANEELFVEACQQLHDAHVKVVWDALDIRLITPRMAEALATLRMKRMHFAWDGHSQDKHIEPGIEMLKNVGLKPWRLMFYVLVGAGTSKEYDLERIYKLKELGCDPYVCKYDKQDPYQKKLARWCNNKWVFKSCPDFNDYWGNK